MDRISQLPDELLGKILLFLPTKVAVSTSILSKRWKVLWMWLPNLEYDARFYSQSQRHSLRRFLNLNLRLHRAPVIERLDLKFRNGSRLRSPIKPGDIKLWVEVAVSRRIHELSLHLFDTISKHQTRLPSRLYICNSIVILKLVGDILVDVPPTVCLPCLKTLSLKDVTYSDEESLHQLLSNCPVLEDLDVLGGGNDYDNTYRVIVPSLQRLTLYMYHLEHSKIMINTPSLKKLKVKDHSGKVLEGYYNLRRVSYCFEDMPMLEEADIDIAYHSIDKFVRSITSVRRLSLCFHPVKDYNGKDILFHQLEHLRLCSCDMTWSVLPRLLEDTPNLRELEIYRNTKHDGIFMVEPVGPLDSVPEYLFWSLETFKWTRMYGSQEELDRVKYILRNARNLQIATISFHPYVEEDDTEMMSEELLNCPRGSKTCKLVLI